MGYFGPFTTALRLVVAVLWLKIMPLQIYTRSSPNSNHSISSYDF